MNNTPNDQFPMSDTEGEAFCYTAFCEFHNNEIAPSIHRTFNEAWNAAMRHAKANAPVAAEVGVSVDELKKMVRITALAQGKAEAELAMVKDQLKIWEEADLKLQKDEGELITDLATAKSKIEELKKALDFKKLCEEPILDVNSICEQRDALMGELATSKARIERILNDDIEWANLSAKYNDLQDELAASNESRGALKSEVESLKKLIKGDFEKLQRVRNTYQSLPIDLPDTQPVSPDIKVESVPVALVEQLAEALKKCVNPVNFMDHVREGEEAITAYQSYKSGAPSKVSEVLGEVQSAINVFLIESEGKISLDSEVINSCRFLFHESLAKLAALRKGNRV